MQDVQFITAMGPPGGGRNSVTNRYLRHFSVISVTAFDNDTLSTIFSALVDWWMKRANFGANVTKLAKPLVAASLEVYETIQKELLPTPNKSHYTFNLRDVSKVIQVSVTKDGPSQDAACHVNLQSSKIHLLPAHHCQTMFPNALQHFDQHVWLCRVCIASCRVFVHYASACSDHADVKFFHGPAGSDQSRACCGREQPDSGAVGP